MILQFLLFFSMIVSIVSSLFHGPPHPIRDILKSQIDSTPEKAFKIWHFLHKREYRIESEEGREKFEIFKKNFQIIKKHNTNSEKSYTLGLNYFADMTIGEFHKKYLNNNKIFFHQNLNKHYELNYENNVKKQYLKEKEEIIKDKSQFYSLFWSTPDENEQVQNNHESHNLRFLKSDVKSDLKEYATINWIGKSSLNQYVEEQGECGSCWAFSAVQSLQAAYSIKTGKSEKFSKQQLVDCDEKSDACNGGFPHFAMQYVKKNGLLIESEYPYKEDMTELYQKNCRFKEIISKNSQNLIKIKNYEYCFDKEECRNDENLFEMLKNGPLSAVVDASEEFMLYESGVYDKPCNEKNHAILIAGYHKAEKETDDSYWIVKNSWGYLWGDHGYIKIKQSKEYNSCLLNQYYLRPILE